MTLLFQNRSLFLVLAGYLASAGCDQADKTTAQPGTPAQTAAKVGETSPHGDRNAPPELEKIIAERRAACAGKIGPKFGESLTADFNADGKTDYVVTEDRFLCADDEGGQSQWGKAGPQAEFLVSSRSGYTLTDGFGHYLDATNIKKRATGDTIQFELSDTSREGCPELFAVTWSWTGKKMELTDRRNAKGKKVDDRGCPASPSSELPLKLGYYGHQGEGCGVAMRSYANGITISEKFWGDIDGDYPLRPVKDLGNGKYKLGEAADVIRVTGPNSFVAEEGTEYERRLIWCAGKAPD